MKTYCILGNCQANALASTLQCCHAFKEAYSFQRVTPIHRITMDDHLRFLAEMLPAVDLFIYQPISDRFRGGGFGFDRALSSLSEQTAVISYPSIQFYGYHAPARTWPEPPDIVNDITNQTFGVSGSELFHFSQVMRAWIDGLSPKDAEAAFHKGYPGDAESVRHRARHSLAHLRQAEEEFDITTRLHDRIAENYQERQLFWSPRHPKGELLAAVALEVLSHIGINPSAEDNARMLARDPLKLPQYPLQDFVAKALELKFEGLNSYRSKHVQMTLEEFVASYYALYDAAGREVVTAQFALAFPELAS